MKRSIASALLLASSAIAAAAPQPVPNRAPLQPGAFNLLPLTSVKPTGWLLDQLRIQSRGLSGHLDEFWPDLAQAADGSEARVKAGSAVPTFWMDWYRSL